MRHRRSFVAIPLVAGLLISAISRPIPLLACAPAPHAGETVRISGESAWIIWDSRSKTEHFIRRADFETNAKDFGFLVPTPTQPDLGEVGDGVFDSLAGITQARRITRNVVKNVFGFGLLPESAMPSGDKGIRYGAMPPPGAAVEVLHEQKVAGFDATVLKADDPRALADWLTEHGYESRPALTEWLQWYTDHAWIITAFKLTKDGPGGQLGMKAVRMSFQTDRPFYPYREPEDTRKNADTSRYLRLFFLSNQKYEGTLGDKGTWPGSTVWANDISGSAGLLTSTLKLADSSLASSLDAARYLTEFEDFSTPRPGTDEVYFRPAADQATRERPPIVTVIEKVRLIPGPMGGIALMVLPFLIGAGFVIVRKRRRTI